MKLAIVIATFNRINLLSKLLNQINDLILPENVLVKIIVVNDGSTDGTIEMLKKNFSNVQVILGNGIWWWTKCMNEGFKKAIEIGYDHVLVLNDDVEIQPNYLETLLNDYATLPFNSILGSSSVSINKPYKIEFAGANQFIKWRLKFVPYIKGFKLMDDNFKGIHKSWILCGRGTLIPVIIFKQIGFYDEKLIQYGSDDEFCIRANLKKIPVYISWNARIYNNTYLTSIGSAFLKSNLSVFIKSFFDKYSVNSLIKVLHIYFKYGYKILTPFYLLYFILGTFYARFIKYK